MFASASTSSSSFVVPTTTLAAQTSNNTSAANTFKTQSNDNRGAGNISKVDVHTLLYPGATTKIYAHMVLWFGQSDHMNIGYSETNQQQVQSQIDDMVSRGIDGAVIDWYGPGNSIDHATQLVMAAAESHPGFTFAIMIDQGAIEWYSCSGCSPQQALIGELQYIERTYFPSPAYMKIDGKPMVTNFNVSLSYPSINWETATAAMSTPPALVCQNNNGFSQWSSEGSYAWVMPTASDYGMSYLTSFYDAGDSAHHEQTMGATYKGFNDTLASWGSHRIMGQQCGQSWLQTFSKIDNMYNSGNQLPDLQLVTWNDYEEATEIESGIDNCLSVSASVNANTLQWNAQGNENTVDHYTVYISEDGQNLMPLTDISTGENSLNLCGFSIPNATYKMFVQAVGKPTLANQMSGSTNYNSTCNIATAGPPSTTTLSFSAAPETVTIAPGMSGTFTVKATPQSGSFTSPISLTCGSLPGNLNCSFSPATIIPGTGTATSTLTVTSTSVPTTAVNGGMNSQRHGEILPISASWMLPFGLVGFAFLGKNKRKFGVQALLLCGLLGLGMAATSCGGGKTVGAEAASASTPVTYSITVNGSSSAGKLSTTINVIVQ